MKKGLSFINKKEGFSLVEAIIAAAILMLIVTSVSTSYMSIRRYVISSAVETQAIFLAQEGLEAARNIRDYDFNLLVSGTTNGLLHAGNSWSFSGNQDVNGIYTRKIIISTPSANTRLVSAQVDWIYDGTSKSITLNREFTNWRIAKINNNGPSTKWPFDDNGGCITLDSMGTSHGNLMPVTCPVSSPLWAAGKVGNSSLSFNPENSNYNFVQVPDANILDLSTSGTIIAWINPVTIATMNILHKGSATNNSDEAYFLRLNNNGRITAGGRDASGNLLSIQSSLSFEIGNEGWTHVAFTWDSSGMKIFIDGLSRTNPNTTVLNARNSAGSLQIGGNYPGSGSNRFRGEIDEVSVYNRALSASEILTIYNAEK